MSLGISGNRFDQLGRKLSNGDALTNADLLDLETAFGAYGIAMEGVQQKLLDLSLGEVTSRLKTTPTLVDKLKLGNLTIRGIQDLAGVRLVIDGGRLKQDDAVTQITRIYRDNKLRVADRRVAGNDSHGYRAVHVIVAIDRVPVEIQVRTDLQHRWAEIVEKLGDKWGRQIRYGGEPDDADRDFASGVTRASFLAEIQGLSSMIDEFEQRANSNSLLHRRLRLRSRRTAVMHWRRVSLNHAHLVSLEETLRNALRHALRLCDEVR